MNGLERPVLCWVTALDRMARPGEDAVRTADRFIERVKAAAEAGVTLIQVREPTLEAVALRRLVARCVRAVEGTRCRVVVNDRVDVALAAGAHGVHLREDSVQPDSVRRLVPEPLLVGRSVHSAVDAARVAATGQVDYLIFGTVFPTGSKPQPHIPAGVEALRQAVRAAAPLPVLAIGGVTPDKAPDLADAGAAGIAGIGLFLDWAHARPISETVRELRRPFERSPVATETR